MTRAKVLEGEYLKTGDQEPDLLVQLIKDNQVPKDLSDITDSDVEIYLREANSHGLLELSNSATIDSPSEGIVTYAWGTDDTKTAATLEGEFVITDSNSEQATYPNDGTFNIYIEEGLA